jgi:hypothetical protein
MTFTVSSAGPSRPVNLEHALHDVAPSEQELALRLRQVGSGLEEAADDGPAVRSPVLLDEPVEEVLDVRLVGHDRVAEPAADLLPERSVELPPPREGQHFPLERAAAFHQLVDPRHLPRGSAGQRNPLNGLR